MNPVRISNRIAISTLSIPVQWGHTLLVLDKFRYLQSCMCRKISYSIIQESGVTMGYAPLR